MGFPSPAKDFEELRLSLDDILGIRNPATFLMRCKGSVLSVANDRDVVLVVDSSKRAENGSLVVFDVSGEHRVKRVYFRGDKYAVTDPNGDHVEMFDIDDFDLPEYSRIFGVVISTVEFQ